MGGQGDADQARKACLARPGLTWTGACLPACMHLFRPRARLVPEINDEHPLESYELWQLVHVQSATSGDADSFDFTPSNTDITLQYDAPSPPCPVIPNNAKAESVGEVDQTSRAD